MLQFIRKAFTKWKGPAYRTGLYERMHARGAFQGKSWRTHVETLRRLVPGIENLTILDYGCGPKGGLREAFGSNVIPYDPYVAEFSAPPWQRKFDAVFSSDVLEHMTRNELEELVSRLREAKPRYVFLNVSTRPAEKKLPNGANAHLTVKPAAWWLRFLSEGLGEAYNVALAEQDLLREEGTFCFVRSSELPTA